MRKQQRDKQGILRFDGALIYPEGDALFDVMIVHEAGSWKNGDPMKIVQQGNKQAIKISSLTDDPSFIDLVERNHHIITVGLASNSQSEDENLNSKLAFARAHNLAVAIHRSTDKPSSAIWPQSLGFHTEEKIKVAEIRNQRPVVVIGARAHYDIEFADIIEAAFALAPTKFDLTKYTLSQIIPTKEDHLATNAEYISTENLKISDLNASQKSITFSKPNNDSRHIAEHCLAKPTL